MGQHGFEPHGAHKTIRDSEALTKAYFDARSPPAKQPKKKKTTKKKEMKKKAKR